MASAAQIEAPLKDGVMDHLNALIASTDPLLKPHLSDSLLELRSAWQQRDLNPTQLIATFLQNRKRLARHDYLLTHRFRRRLEKSWLAHISTPSQELTQELQLSWTSFQKLTTSLQHQIFEQGEHHWEDIHISIQAR